MCDEEYSLKFILLTEYASYLVSNHSDVMSWVMARVSNILKEKCCKTMIYGDVTLSRFLVYALSIE